MEKRVANIIVQEPGGTAAKNARTYKISLPSTWIKELGISDTNREVELCFDGTSITISKKQDIQEYIATNVQKGKQVLLLSYYDRETLCSKIAVDYTEKTLCVNDYVSDVIRTAFGNNRTPTWGDYQYFLESRCLPRTRAGLREYLETIGVEGYEPLEIIKKTAGRMAEDEQWIKVEEMQ